MKMKILKYMLWICCFSLALYGCKRKQTSTLSFDIQDYDGTAPRVTIGLKKPIGDDRFRDRSGKYRVGYQISSLRYRKYAKI